MQNSSCSIVYALKLGEYEANHDGRHMPTHAHAHSANKNEEYVGQEEEAYLEVEVAAKTVILSQYDVINDYIQSFCEVSSFIECSHMSLAVACLSEMKCFKFILLTH